MTPTRMCCGCRSNKPKGDFIRVVRMPDGKIIIDKTQKSDGRGVYVCKSEKCLDIAIRKKGFARGLRTNVDDEFFVQLREYITALE